jgi:hypothetical protein
MRKILGLFLMLCMISCGDDDEATTPLPPFDITPYLNYGDYDPCQIDYIMAEMEYKRNTDMEIGYFAPTINLNRYDIDPLANVQDARSQEFEEKDELYESRGYLVKAVKNTTFDIVADFECNRGDVPYPQGCQFVILKRLEDYVPGTVPRFVTIYSQTINTTTTYIRVNESASLSKDESLVACFLAVIPYSAYVPDISVTKFNKFRISHKK